MDFKGKIYDGHILCAVEANFRLVNFTYVRNITAEETAKALFTNVICNYGSAVTFVTDRGGPFISKLTECLFDFGSIHHRVSSAYNPKAELAETLAVRPLAKALRANMFQEHPKKIKEQVKLFQFLVNNLQTHPLCGKSSFALLCGSENGFYHPSLEYKNASYNCPKFWEERFAFLEKLTQLFVDKYDLQLSRMKSLRHTVNSLKLSVGDLVYYRIFQYPESANFLKSILPKHNLAKIKIILGQTSLILTDVKSGRDISRNLVDVYPAKFGGNFSNLFQNTKDAIHDELLETEMGMDFSQNPKLETEIPKSEPKTQSKERSLTPVVQKRVLRVRKPVNYKE